jgi:DNA-binding IclR family transcriptional regulator
MSDPRDKVITALLASDAGSAAIRVVLALSRARAAERLTMDLLAERAGLSRRGAYDGLAEATRRGWVERGPGGRPGLSLELLEGGR